MRITAWLFKKYPFISHGSCLYKGVTPHVANPILKANIFAYETALQSDNILHVDVDLQDISPSPLRREFFGFIKVVIPKVNLYLFCAVNWKLHRVSSRFAVTIWSRKRQHNSDLLAPPLCGWIWIFKSLMGKSILILANPVHNVTIFSYETALQYDT